MSERTGGEPCTCLPCVGHRADGSAVVVSVSETLGRTGGPPCTCISCVGALGWVRGRCIGLRCRKCVGPARTDRVAPCVHSLYRRPSNWPCAVVLASGVVNVPAPLEPTRGHRQCIPCIGAVRTDTRGANGRFSLFRPGGHRSYVVYE